MAFKQWKHIFKVWWVRLDRDTAICHLCWKLRWNRGGWLHKFVLCHVLSLRSHVVTYLCCRRSFWKLQKGLASCEGPSNQSSNHATGANKRASLQLSKVWTSWCPFYRSFPAQQIRWTRPQNVWQVVDIHFEVLLSFTLSLVLFLPPFAEGSFLAHCFREFPGNDRKLWTPVEFRWFRRNKERRLVDVVKDLLFLLLQKQQTCNLTEHDGRKCFFSSGARWRQPSCIVLERRGWRT